MQALSTPSLTFDLLGLTPAQRHEFLRTLTTTERRQLLVGVRRDLGTPYGLWQDDPVGFCAQILGVELWSKQRELVLSVEQNQRTVVPAAHAVGKMVADYEPILTPDGWRKHGDLRPDDFVFAVDGTPARVLCVFPHPGKDLFRVTFNDGSSLDVGAEHLWTVRTRYKDAPPACAVCGAAVTTPSATFCPTHRIAIDGFKHCSACRANLPVEDFYADRGKADRLSSRCRGCVQASRRQSSRLRGKPGDAWGWRTMTTAELIDYGGLSPVGHRRAEIPMCLPVQFPEQMPLPLDPYLIGQMIGDGHCPNSTLTTADDDVAARISLTNRIVRMPSQDYGYQVHGISAALRCLGIRECRSHDKFIPGVCMTASVADRTALLHGLMDSDGTVDSKGSTEFSTVSRQLAEDVASLVRGLGGIAVVKAKKPGRYTYSGEHRTGRPSWRVRVTMTTNPFWLQRKAERWADAASRRQARVGRLVQHIEPIGVGDASCIAIDHPSHLYVAGADNIVTHNTYGAAMLLAWWCSVHDPATVMAVTTAPKFRQVQMLLWPHVHRVHSSAGLAGELNQVQWKIGGRIVAYGFSASDYDESAVQGIHEEHLLILVDEAGGIGHVLGRALESITTGGHTRLGAIGNAPTDEEGTWFEERTQSALWHTVRIAWEDSPNFTGEAVAPEIARSLIDQRWVDEQITEFGPESAFVIARVHAQFPHGATNKTIPWGWIEDASDPEAQPEPGTWIRLGADIASDGGDEFVISRAVGNEVSIVHFSSGAQNADSVHVAGKIKEAIDEANVIRAQLGEPRRVRVKIDVIGLGWGVYGTLNAWALEGVIDAEIVAVNVSESAADADKYANKRAEMWWCGREALKPNQGDPRNGIAPSGSAVVLRGMDKRTLAQLNAPNYGHDSRGRIKIEKKDEIKKRGVGSPDRAEAILLALYEPDGGPSETVTPARRRLAKTTISRYPTA